MEKATLRAMLDAPLYAEERSGGEPPVVLLHHGSSSLRAWDDLLPDIAAGRRVLAYDRRGFGASPRDAVFDAGLFDRDTDDLAALLREREAAPAHLIGHSDGATVALLAAANHPEVVLSVTAIATHLRMDQDLHEKMLAWPRPPEWAESRRNEYRDLHGEDWEEVVDSWYRLWTVTLRDWDIEERLAAIRCPVLVVHDRADALASPEHAEGVARQIPHAVVSWYDTGTHSPHRRDQARFHRELERHLAAAEAQPGEPVGAPPAGRTRSPNEAPRRPS